MSAPDLARGVFDCVVYLQAFLSESGPAAEAFRLAEAGQCHLFVSDSIEAEVLLVLSRPRFSRASPDLSRIRVETYLARIGRVASRLADVPEVFQYPRDPNDEKYINLALASDARYLVTQDKDLLDLMDPGRPEGQAFRSRFPGLTILRPGPFLRELRR